MKLTRLEAQALVDAHDIDSIIESDEETDLLRESNPVLLGAYVTLRDIAAGKEWP